MGLTFHPVSLRYWCRDCRRGATQECGDTCHALCSLRKLRSEQVVPKLQRLQSAATSARDVVRALLKARHAVETQLEEWRARLRQVEEAEDELWAAADAGRDLAALQLGIEEGLEETLRTAASIVGAECQMHLELEAESASWKADLQLAGGRLGILQPFLLQLHLDESLVKVGVVQAFTLRNFK